MTEELRRTGIEAVGALHVPWGAHLCLFYETAKDLLDVNAAYFRAGLEDGEFGVWALPGQISRSEAIAGLADAIPGFQSHVAARRIELVDGHAWYHPSEQFDARLIVRGWHDKLARALERGFTGVRVSGNAFWCETGLWDTFAAYEDELEASLTGKKMIVLCTYPLDKSRAADILNVACHHNVSLVRRHGRLELLEPLVPAEDGSKFETLNGLSEEPKAKHSRHPASAGFPGQENLTARERAVLEQVVKGASNKAAARKLGVSPRTIEFHRANVMRKLGARNLPDLVAMVLPGRSDLGPSTG